jgi:hypothetical protein
MSVNEKMTAIADAIRGKTGKTEELTLDAMASGINEVYEAGQKAEHEAFWDAYQENGSRTNYYFSFYYWADGNFKPKYNITAKSFERGFMESRITDLKQLLLDSGVTLGFTSNCETYALYEAFLNSQITHIPALESTRINNAASCFNGCKKLVSIDNIALNDNCNYDSAFKNCTALEEVRFGSKISKTTHFSAATKLSKASIESIINALLSTTSGLTVSFSKTAKEAAFTAEEWSALIATKTNWTISLA